MYDLLITGADVLQLDGSAAAVLPRHSIAIAGGRIAAIAPEIDPGLARETIPARGMLAIPGLINAHAHVSMGLFRGVVEDVPVEEWFNGHIWPMESNLTDEDVYWGAMLGLAEMIEAGVTCVADHYFAMDEVARAVDEVGLRANLAWAVFSGPDEAAALARTARFVERWHGAAGGRIAAWLGPHSPYTCTPDFLARVAAEAARLGTGIHIHLSETADQVAQSMAAHGKTPVAVAHAAGLFAVPALAAHVAHPTPEDVAVMAAHGVAVAVTPKTEMKLGLGVAPVAELRAAGVAVALGSDGAASNNSYDILEAARLVALLEKHARRDARALPVGEALALATREGARALGLAGVTGELREGLQADVVLLRRADPHVQPVHDPAATLLYSARAADVDTVIVAGRVLMRRRRLLTIDRRRVLAEARRRVARLTGRRAGRQVARYPTAS
ncbi:MAG TPA: amidohydrolase [Chloroflexaceae bacterium]|nr:amidohydrolase [Chloroflexaceae bacterium]